MKVTERIQEFADTLSSVGINPLAVEKLEHSTDAFRVVTDSFLIVVVSGSDNPPTLVQLTQTQFTTANPETTAHAQERLFSLFPALLQFFGEEQFTFDISAVANFIDLELDEEGVVQSCSVIVGEEGAKRVREEILRCNYDREALERLANEALEHGIKGKVQNMAQKILQNPVIQTQTQAIVGVDGKAISS